ncbi:hypothetical protein JY232_04915 [Streptococcus thermophilus]|uniref:hypothetical protein n=1 Tax=Streptococcus thermophilus TaxID=1308 RepID=UPI0019D13B21|nr:hypothetical protein [Streptococcus thermophilus]MBN6047597.1 hypothetical protein [Streptococcus thermophilus]
MKLTINKYYLLLITLIFLNLKFFYLVDTSNFNLFFLNYTDFVFIINVSVFLYQLIRNNFNFDRASFVFFSVIILLVIISAIRASMVYNQSFFSGIVAQRLWFSWMLIFYFIINSLNFHRMTIEGIKKTITLLCTVYSLVCILQYFLIDIYSFTYVVENTRYNDTRLFFNVIFLVFAIGIKVDSVFLVRKNHIINIVELLMYFFVIIFITKGRMQSLSILIAIVLCTFLRQNISIKRKLLYSFYAMIVTVLFLQTSMGQDLLNLSIGKSVQADTLSIRDSARNYYWGLYTKSWGNIFFGSGIPNANNTYAISVLNPIWSGSIDARYYLDDVGIMAIIVRYGLLGILIWIMTMVFNLKNSFKIYYKSGEVAYLLFFFVDILGCWTLIPTMFNNSPILPMITAMSFYNFKVLSTMEVRKI